MYIMTRFVIFNLALNSVWVFIDLTLDIACSSLGINTEVVALI